MTREESIKRLKELKARCERLSVSNSGGYTEKWRADAEAVGMAIERLEAMKDGKSDRWG